MEFVNLIFLLSYVAFLFIQAVFINGVFIAAHGETTTLPSGKKVDSEMILYPLYKFLTQHKIVKDFYPKDKSDELMQKARMVMGNLKEDNMTDFYVKIRKGLKVIDPELMLQATIDKVGVYKEHKEYRFSKYLRKPIIQCIICMASFWGFFTYWPLISYLYGVNYFTIALWVVNTFCLSYVNFLIYKKK
jgi:hypothetical protein